MQGASPVPQNTSRKNLLLALIVLTSFITPFMGAAVNIALPEIARELSMTAIGMSWVSMSFLLASVAVLLPIGKIADIYGRKKLFLLGNAIVVAASFFCALATNPAWLIISRVVQGVGSAMMFATGTAIITSAYPPEQRGKALGINVSAVYLGLTLAPLLGGFLTDWLGWRSIFVITIPLGLIVIGTTYYAIRAEWREAQGESFDMQGSVIYIISISILMYGFSKLPDPLAVFMTFAGFAGMTAFVLNELKAGSPILNMKLFSANRIFAFSNLAALINYAATFAVTFILSLYLQYIHFMKPSAAGMVLVTQPVMMALTASFSGRLSDRYDPRILASAGMAIITAGLVMLIFIDGFFHHWYLVASLIILGTGFGMFSSPNTNAVMSSVEKKYLGVASATIGTMRLAGQMTSMAIATLVLHTFMGNSKITTENHPLFLQSARIIFVIFAVLCLFGVFASLARGKRAGSGE